MIRNEVDDFRAAFLDRVIQEQQTREREQRRKQAHCFHQYRLQTATHTQKPVGALGPVNLPFVTLVCPRCEHTIVRHVKAHTRV